jgi:hypothetical protein
MSIVNDQVKAGIALVSTYEGAMKYLKGVLWDRFNFWLDRMADLNMTDVEKVKVIASDYIGVNLSPSQCSSVRGILGLEAVVKAYKDAATFQEFEKAIAKNPQGMKTEIDKFITSARHTITMEIVHAWKNKATNLDVPFEERVIAYQAFSLSARAAEELAQMPGSPVDFYSLAGVNPDTFELY